MRANVTPPFEPAPTTFRRAPCYEASTPRNPARPIEKSDRTERRHHFAEENICNVRLFDKSSR